MPTTEHQSAIGCLHICLGRVLLLKLADTHLPQIPPCLPKFHAFSGLGTGGRDLKLGSWTSTPYFLIKFITPGLKASSLRYGETPSRTSSKYTWKAPGLIDHRAQAGLIYGPWVSGDETARRIGALMYTRG